MPNRSSRLIRLAGFATAFVFACAALIVSYDWLNATGLLRHPLRYLAIRFLEAFLAGYLVIGMALVLVSAVLGGVVWRARSRRQTGRWLLLCISVVLALALAEAAAAARLSWVHRFPTLPRRFPAPAHAENTVRIAVIGGSSALGVPYDGWLSVGAIVGHELQKAMPQRHVQVEVMAEKGATLETMHLKLASDTSGPDVLIIFSGHNEFLARFSLDNRVAYYRDDHASHAITAWLEAATQFSPLYTLILEDLEKYRVSVIPARSLGMMETLVGRPVCTPDQKDRVVAAFQRRLEAIVADCERIGCMPVLVIPPANDTWGPNQSYAGPSTGAVARRTLARRLLEIRSMEEQDPSGAVSAYRAIVAEQPMHADAQYRLARLLQLAGSFAEAKRHYVLARDYDGLPLRCIASLEGAYQAIAQRHTQSVILVDGPAILRLKSRHGILANDLFHDNVHLTLAGQVALAEGILRGLKARGAFGYSALAPAPMLDPRQCADLFRIDASAWAAVCDRTAAMYAQLALFPSASADRLEWRDRYVAAARQIRAGVHPCQVGIPGIGVGCPDLCR